MTGQSANGSADNRRVVEEWLASGRPASGITDSFQWVLPRSVAARVRDGDRLLHGAAGLEARAELDRTNFSGPIEMTPQFLIGEGEWVVWQGHLAATTHDGAAYRALHVFSFRLSGGRIDEVFEHTNQVHLQTMTEGAR